MANLFKTIYTGTLAQYTSASKDANALYMVYDESTKVKSMYHGATKVAGDFIIVNGAAPTSPEEGVIYYISEFGKKEAEGETPAVAGKPYVGFWDGAKWVALSDSATIDSLDERIEALENATVISGNTVEGSIGKAVETLIGADTVEGSVKEQIKTAIEGLDNEDTETAGSVVVAVSTEDGIAVPTKQAMSVAKVADDDKAEGMAAEYQIKIGDHALETKISIPYAESVLTNAVLGKMDSTVDAETGTVTTPEGSTQDDALVMVFKKADGTFVGVKVDISTILVESEFKDGLSVSGNGEVSVKLVDNDDYLQFGEVEEGNAPVVANVVSLSDAKAAEGDDAAVTGLADALDVKTVIEENEKVTAAALNDLNQRVGKNEDLTTTAKVVVPAINELKAAIEDKNVDAEGEEGDSALVTASAKDNTVTVASTQKLQDAVKAAESAVQTIEAETEGQEVTVSEKSDDNGYTIGVTKATYAAAEGQTEKELSALGLVDADVLAKYVADEIAKNAVYWKTLE